MNEINKIKCINQYKRRKQGRKIKDRKKKRNKISWKHKKKILKK